MIRILLLTLLSVNCFASLKVSKELDKESIKKMTGCYEVVFQSSETFANDNDYKYYPKYKSGALEWIFVDEESNDSINLQHLLITRVGVMKHWRQKWDYQATKYLQYQGFSDWSLNTLSEKEAKGNWTQRVYQVDDSPRYECSAPWIHSGLINYWECTANAPLPRREFSVRSDYNILKRKNRHELTVFGHVHDQDNLKISKELNDSEKLIAMEKTYNTYKKVEDEKCTQAKEWWPKHRAYWVDVTRVWDEVLYTNNLTKFQFKKDGVNLWEKLFELDDTLSTSSYDSENAKKVIMSTIKEHIL